MDHIACSFNWPSDQDHRVAATIYVHLGRIRSAILATTDAEIVAATGCSDNCATCIYCVGNADTLWLLTTFCLRSSYSTFHINISLLLLHENGRIETLTQCAKGFMVDCFFLQSDLLRLWF